MLSDAQQVMRQEIARDELVRTNQNFIGPLLPNRYF